MNGMYWEQFLRTGRIADYLNYRSGIAAAGSRSEECRDGSADKRTGLQKMTEESIHVEKSRKVSEKQRMV